MRSASSGLGLGRRMRSGPSSSSRPLRRPGPSRLPTIAWLGIVACSSFVSFYGGVWIGIGVASGSRPSKLNGSNSNGASAPSEEEVQRRVEELAAKKVQKECESVREKAKRGKPRALHAGVTRGKDETSSTFLPEKIAHGLARVTKDDLMTTFDFGVPPNPEFKGNDAVILYSKAEAFPSDEEVAAAAAAARNGDEHPPHISAKQATENCDVMNVILMNNPGNARQCYALIGGQYQSYHVQRWMRRPDKPGEKLDPGLPLKLSSRAWTAKGRLEFPSPNQRHVDKNRDKLLTYLTELKDVKSRLKVILEKIDRKTIVVLTCNKGQSELLVNFACSARARGFDLSNVLVFPTDMDTKLLAEGMGLKAFYDEKLMASVPEEEAKVYGDGVFSAVMFAKVLCVQLVNELGYDLLFQDADVVWYKDPVSFFEDETLPKFDLYFQDDGSRQERYAPYSANSGFYYVKSNPRTKHLFRHFVYSGDLLTAWSSHQQVLIALLAEHSSTFGLSVKVYPKELEWFPGGLQFHRQKETMKRIVKGESDAYIFHMSWTSNKDDKVKFFQQMGEWYLKDECAGGKGARELGLDEEGGALRAKGEDKGGGVDLTGRCCAAEPVITCHYRDKPSKIPCPDAPLITEKGKAFFKGFAGKDDHKGFW